MVAGLGVFPVPRWADRDPAVRTIEDWLNSTILDKPEWVAKRLLRSIHLEPQGSRRSTWKRRIRRR